MATTNKKQTKKHTDKKTKKAAIKKTTEKKSVKKNATASKAAKKETVKKTAKSIDEKPVNTDTATVNQPVKTPQKQSVRRRLVVNYNQLAPELIELLNEKYPLGWRDYIIKVEKGNGEFFHAIMLDTEDTSYLIKVTVKVDNEITDDIEKDLFGLIPDDDFTVDDEPDEEYEDKDES
ncbi:MAG: hypothetical protein LBQ28_07635 [Prevotellaceae bacterium]|jgi:hypothetical protein|nr:hypothetical protein [Prevotellaceae bacterium]